MSDKKNDGPSKRFELGYKIDLKRTTDSLIRIVHPDWNLPKQIGDLSQTDLEKKAGGKKYKTDDDYLIIGLSFLAFILFSLAVVYMLLTR